MSQTARARASGKKENPLDQTIISDFLVWASSTPEKLDDLYSSPHASQCILRALPPVARVYVTRVLFLTPGTPFSPSALRAALQRRTRARDRHDAALLTLRSLRVFLPADGGNEGGEARLVVNPVFAEQLRLCVVGGVGEVFGGVVDVQAVRTAEELERFSGGRLEEVLNFSIGGGDEDEKKGREPSQALQSALAGTKILEPCEDGRYMQITSVGFQFLLKDSKSQIWILLRSVINRRFAGSEFQALNLLFQLSFAQPCHAYSLSALDTKQIELASCLDELGIISIDNAKGVFFPSQMGTSLVASASRAAEEGAQAVRPIMPTSKSTGGDIRIIVETNFRLYAYTTSTFQMNLLGLFTHMRYQLPNLVVGHLTREKVREALINGITADQIISFLNSHAHPRMINGTIPDTVTDEIKLWEAEQERVQFLKGFLISEFDSSEKYARVLAYANDLGARLWSNDQARQMVVLRDDYQRIREFIKKS